MFICSWVHTIPVQILLLKWDDSFHTLLIWSHVSSSGPVTVRDTLLLQRVRSRAKKWWRDLEAQGGSYLCMQIPEGRVQGRWSQTLQCCPMTGQEAVGTNWNTETHKVSSNLQETFFFFLLTGTICLERLWILLSLLEILRSYGAGQASLGVPTCADIILIVSFLARHALFELSYVWACGFAFLCHPP